MDVINIDLVSIYKYIYIHKYAIHYIFKYIFTIHLDISKIDKIFINCWFPRKSSNGLGVHGYNGE